MLVTRSGGAWVIRDPLMRLYHTNAEGGIWFTSDGAEIAAEHDGAGAVKRRYVRGPGMDEPIVWYEGAGTGDRRFLHADERGSIIAVSDAAGNPIAINKYDEYGVPAPGNLGRFQYTGQAWMPEIGLYHYKARAYAPRLGRFMQTDPIGYGDGMNLYGYVGGDPVNVSDPLGLSSNDENKGRERWWQKDPPRPSTDSITVTGQRLHDQSAQALGNLQSYAAGFQLSNSVSGAVKDVLATDIVVTATKDISETIVYAGSAADYTFSLVPWSLHVTLNLVAPQGAPDPTRPRAPKYEAYTEDRKHKDLHEYYGSESFRGLVSRYDNNMGQFSEQIKNLIDFFRVFSQMGGN